MLVGDTIPEIGTQFEWDVSEILTRVSGDLSLDYGPGDVECKHCKSIFSDGWYEDADLNRCHVAGTCEPRSIPIEDAWERLLYDKRDDEHYPYLVEVIRREGFTKNLTCREVDGKLVLGDGHHRVAAALELGIKSVPVTVCADWNIANDSGSWWPEDEEREQW